MILSRKSNKVGFRNPLTGTLKRYPPTHPSIHHPLLGGEGRVNQVIWPNAIDRYSFIGLKEVSTKNKKKVKEKCKRRTQRGYHCDLRKARKSGLLLTADRPGGPHLRGESQRGNWRNFCRSNPSPLDSS